MLISNCCANVVIIFEMQGKIKKILKRAAKTGQNEAA